MLKFNCVSRSEPVNPSMRVIFMLAIGAVFGYTHKTRQGRCSADLALARRQINKGSQ